MMNEFFDDLPRGDGNRRAHLDRQPDAQWLPVNKILGNKKFTFDPDGTPEKILLGAIGNKLIGLNDDRHMITVAGSRAGKGISAVVPNLLTYRGSILATDPKGELASITATWRAKGLGQQVHILDPFGRVTAEQTAPYRKSYNPLSILKNKDGKLTQTAIEDAGLIADALIIASGNDDHWDDSAQNFIEGIILHVVTDPDYEGFENLITVRDLLVSHVEGNLFQQMLNNADNFSFIDKDISEAIKHAAMDFYQKPETERNSVLSTARRHTKFLDFKAMKNILTGHDFDLTDLKTKKEGVTVYLCLPATRLSNCARWFRLFINITLEAMERVPKPPEIPVLMVLDEFAILGHMKQLEDAAGQIAGFGVKLWPILQDLTQLKKLYKERWETFMGNAGVLQFFGNNDLTTLEFIEKRLGKTTLNVSQQSELSNQQKEQGLSGKSQSPQVQSLLTAEEASRYFARDDHLLRQLIILADHQHNMILQRIKYYDHPDFEDTYDEHGDFQHEQ